MNQVEMDGECSTNRSDEKYKFWSRNLNERENFVDLGRRGEVMDFLETGCVIMR